MVSTAPGTSLLSTSRWHNDLETSAEQLYPDLARLRAAIVGAGWSSVAMSGSGSTLFLSFADEPTALGAEERLRGLVEGQARVLRTRSAEGAVASRVPFALTGD